MSLTNQELKERKSARDTRWRAAHKERVADHNARYYNKNKVRLLAANAKRNAENKERIARYRAKRVAERKRILDRIKYMRGCVDCKTKDGRLDFDHIDKSTKLFKVSSGLLRSWPAIKAEIRKCVVRCASCHQKHHKAEVELSGAPCTWHEGGHSEGSFEGNIALNEPLIEGDGRF
jgi:hypothetical protein